MRTRSQKIKETVRLFKIFSDETRLRIIALLIEDEFCVQDISETLHMSQSSISHQLKLLRDMNVVEARREGKHMFYALKDAHIKTIFQMGYDHANEC